MICLNKQKSSNFSRQIFFSWFLVFSLGFLLPGCDKVEINNQVENPVFFLDYFVEGDNSKRISAGVNDYYLFTDNWEMQDDLVGQSILATHIECHSECKPAFGLGFFTGNGLQNLNNFPDGPETGNPDLETTIMTIYNESGNQMLINWPMLGFSQMVEDTFVYDLSSELSDPTDSFMIRIDSTINITLSAQLANSQVLNCDLGISILNDSLDATEVRIFTFTSSSNFNIIEWSGEEEGLLLPNEQNISAVLTNDTGCEITVGIEILNYNSLEPFTFSVNYEKFQSGSTSPAPYVQLFYQNDEGIMYKSDGTGVVVIDNIIDYEVNEFGNPTIQYEIGFVSNFIRMDQNQGSLKISGIGILASQDFR